MDKFLKYAYLQAKKAYKIGEVPVGAVIVKDGKVVASAYNKREIKQNALFHAEVLAINKACKKLRSFRLDDCEMYVTLEPCPMCSGAILNARIKKVYYGCKDENFGCCGGKINVLNGDFGLKVDTINLCDDKCKALILDFFKNARQKGKIKKLLNKTVEIQQKNGKFFVNYQNTECEVVFAKNTKANKVVAVVEDLSDGKIELVVGENAISHSEVYNLILDKHCGKTVKVFLCDKTTKIYNL